MQLIINRVGTAACLYDEVIDLHGLVEDCIQRESYVEPTPNGRWTADLRPVGGPVLAPYLQRSLVLDAERWWLTDNRRPKR